MTPPTTDTSREAVDAIVVRLMEAEAPYAPMLTPNGHESAIDEDLHPSAWRMIEALLAERDAALLREKSLKDNTEELRQLRREFNAVKSERDTLRDQLAAARNEALEEAISKTALYLEYDTLRPPEAWDDDEKDHWHTGGIDHLRALLSSLNALKSTTPAPREVTVQEAAWYVCPNDDTALNYLESVYGNDLRCAVSCMLDALRSLANEEQSDG